jgi:hypothetical protein
VCIRGSYIFEESLTKYSHDVAPKPAFEKTFDRIFKRAESGATSPHINAQEIALVFIIMAQGTMFNIEMPNCDSSAEEWLRLSERALVKGEFLSNNTLAGLQTLVSYTGPTISSIQWLISQHLMAHLQLCVTNSTHRCIANSLAGN